ncbi:unnamed protein product [Caenorhabditis brenneri]
MDILIMLAYIEIVIVLLAFCSNSLFTYMLYQANSLHCNCRNLLFLFSISMYLLTISHGLTVFEFLYEGKSYEFIYFVSRRGIAWRCIHELGYGLQSLSLLMFSVERLIASICPASHAKLRVKILFVLLSLLSVIFSIIFSYVIHVGEEMFMPTVAMNFVDISGCVILLIAWKRSLRQYRATVGVFSLEQRFQLSEVYNWSRHLIPAVFLASLSKIIVIVIIWILITGHYTGNEAALYVIIYNNVLNVYTVIMPFAILLKHHKMRKKLMHSQSQKSLETRKTIDGKEIPCKHDYFEFLKQERFLAARFSIPQSPANRAASIVVGLIISILSMVFAQALHLADFHIIAITCLNVVDMAALVILVVSSRFSIKHYKKTAGLVSLETRFQISEVYIWTQAIIPAACLAFVLKFVYVLLIWVLQTVENSMPLQISISHFFQNVLDLFTICIPFLVSTNHRRLSKLKLRGNRVNPATTHLRSNEVHVKTLDGKTLRMSGTIHDHFDFLKNHWK